MPDSNHIPFYRQILEAQLRLLQDERFAFHLPHPLEGRMRLAAGTHFHFAPELFIQIGGLTDFRFPKEKTRLLTGECLLVPRGLPHDEYARNFKGNFLNVVIIFTREGVDIHTALKGARGNRNMTGIVLFQTDKGRRVEQYLDDIVDLYHSGKNGKRRPETEKAVRGLFQAALATLLMIVNQVKAPERTAEHPKISECRKFIIDRLYDPSLSVRKLADQVHYAPDYLSHLFALETSERITDYIHRERIALAKKYLLNPALNIKEIAWSCGFTDPGYFARLFRRIAGETPKTFRKKLGTTFLQTSLAP